MMMMMDDDDDDDTGITLYIIGMILLPEGQSLYTHTQTQSEQGGSPPDLRSQFQIMPPLYLCFPACHAIVMVPALVFGLFSSVSLTKDGSSSDKNKAPPCHAVTIFSGSESIIIVIIVVIITTIIIIIGKKISNKHTNCCFYPLRAWDRSSALKSRPYISLRAHLQSLVWSLLPIRRVVN